MLPLCTTDSCLAGSPPGPPTLFQQSYCPVSQFPARPVAEFSSSCLPDTAFVLVEFNDIAVGPLLQLFMSRSMAALPSSISLTWRLIEIINNDNRSLIKEGTKDTIILV